MFKTTGVVGENNPLFYKFMLYEDEKDYEKDILYGVQSHVVDLSEMSINNQFTTQLPSGNLLILCQVIDQAGAYSNYTVKVTV